MWLSGEIPKEIRGLLLMPDKGEEEAGDWVDWQEHCASLARVCALRKSVSCIEPLGRRLGQLHSHAYMPAAARERTMLMFVTLAREATEWSKEGISDISWMSPLLHDARDVEVSAYVSGVVEVALKGGAGGNGGEVASADVVNLALSTLRAAHGVSPLRHLLSQSFAHMISE